MYLNLNPIINHKYHVILSCCTSTMTFFHFVAPRGHVLIYYSVQNIVANNAHYNEYHNSRSDIYDSIKYILYIMRREIGLFI